MLFQGFLVAAEPLDACQPIINTPILKSGFDNSSSSFIALVIRGNCDFALKVGFIWLVFVLLLIRSIMY